MEPEPIFEPLPGDLTALSVEELQALLKARQDKVVRMSDRDPELIGDMLMPEILDTMQSGVDDIEKIRAELGERDAADTEFEARLQELRGKAAPAEPTAEEKATPEVLAESTEEGDDEGDGDDTGDESEATVTEPTVVAQETPVEVTPPAETAPEVAAEAPAIAEPEPVTAASHRGTQFTVRNVNRRPLPRPQRDREAVLASKPGAGVLLASGIPGFGDGQQVDAADLAKAMIAKRYQQVSAPKGFKDEVIVASINWGDLYPDERWIKGDAFDYAKIEAVTSDQALTASGGLCAPVTPYYEIQDISTAVRPVRDSLASFAAVRGGLNFSTPQTIADVTDGVGIKTAEEDAQGGTFAIKTCQVVECPDFSTSELAMVWHCLEFGNLNSRAWPELIEHWNSLVMAAHARVAEQALLDAMRACSTEVTFGPYYGTAATAVNAILRAAAGMRSRHRMRPDARFRVWAPSWLQDAIAADWFNQQFDRRGVVPGDASSLLRSYGVEPTWYLDTATGQGQVFGAQTAGVLLPFPTEADVMIAPEGSFLFLDGGSLELGIVRDSSLNATNDFQIFGETFEALACIGVESLYMNLTVCPDGTVAAPTTAEACGS